MKRLTTKVTYKVPIGPYCNHTMQKSTSLTRCRFCTDLGKGKFTCVLHNDQLALLGGALIQKSPACAAKQGVVGDTPYVSPKDLMQYAITEYRRIYKDLLDQGVPDKLAHKMAQKEALK